MQIFINGKLLELNPDEKIAITLQINDLADISKANTSYTNKFKVPKTANNVRALEFLGVPGNRSRLQYSLNNVTVTEDSITLLNNGYAEISDSDAMNYNINIYGSEKTFFEKIKTITIKDAYPDTNVVWTSSNLLKYVTSTENFCFPVAQYNANSIHTGFLNQGVETFTRTSTLSTTPHFFVKYLFERIFTSLGYTVTYPMTNDNVFKNMVIPAKKGVSHFFVQNGTSFNLKQCLHDVYCDVLVREVMYRFGLIIKVDEASKSVKFIRLSDLLTTGNILDWSDKFDTFKSETYKIGSYAQKNYFRYSDDDADEKFPDIFPANELVGSFNVNNLTLDAETEVVESQFLRANYWGDESSITSTTAKGRLYYLNFPFGHFLFDVAENEVDDKGVLKVKEVPFQLMYLRTFPDLINFTLEDLGGSSTARQVPIRLCTNDNISFQNFIDANYQQVNKLLNNMLLLKCTMNLSLMDIYKFDFFSRIFLKQYGSYFYVNKITNFQKDKLVEVELVQIPTV